MPAGTQDSISKDEERRNRKRGRNKRNQGRKNRKRDRSDNRRERRNKRRSREWGWRRRKRRNPKRNAGSNKRSKKWRRNLRGKIIVSLIQSAARQKWAICHPCEVSPRKKKLLQSLRKNLISSPLWKSNSLWRKKQKKNRPKKQKAKRSERRGWWSNGRR